MSTFISDGVDQLSDGVASLYNGTPRWT